MLVMDAVRHMVSESGLSARAISLKMGKYEGYIHAMTTKQDNLTLNRLMAVAETIGYKVVMSSDDGYDVELSRTGDDGTTVAEFIRNACVRRGIMQIELCDMLGRGHTYLLGILVRGSSPRVKVFLPIADALGYRLTLRNGDDVVTVTSE